jgi:hypothetical protein
MKRQKTWRKLYPLWFFKTKEKPIGARESDSFFLDDYE